MLGLKKIWVVKNFLKIIIFFPSQGGPMTAVNSIEPPLFQTPSWIKHTQFHESKGYTNRIKQINQPRIKIIK